MLRLLPLLLLPSVAFAQTTVSLAPVQDNTIYDAPSPLSNGAGRFLFAGNNASSLARRALLQFDLAGALPAGATILSVELDLNMTQTQPGTSDVGLHRLLVSWGEGASDAPGMEGGGAPAEAGDATWLQRFFPGTPWATAGGDFEAAASASLPVGAEALYTWASTPTLVADAQSMLDDPTGNFGWLVLGDESTDSTAKRFDSREFTNAATRPALRVTFDAPFSCPVGLVAQQAVRPGTPANPLALLPGTLAPILGTTWDPRVDHASFLPTAVLDVLVLGQQSANVPAPFGTVLVNLAAPNSQFIGAAGAPFALPVPANCALLGLARTVQVAAVDPLGAIELTNAIDVVLGDS